MMRSIAVLGAAFACTQSIASAARPCGGHPRLSEEFATLVRTEYVKWGEVVKRSGARID